MLKYFYFVARRGKRLSFFQVRYYSYLFHGRMIHDNHLAKIINVENLVCHLSILSTHISIYLSSNLGILHSNQQTRIIHMAAVSPRQFSRNNISVHVGNGINATFPSTIRYRVCTVVLSTCDVLAASLLSAILAKRDAAWNTGCTLFIVSQCPKRFIVE